MTTIQRTPNIGLVIRMVRLAVEAPEVRPSFAPVDPPDEPEEPIYPPPPDPDPDPDDCPPIVYDVYGGVISATDLAAAWPHQPPMALGLRTTLAIRADGTLWFAGLMPDNNDGHAGWTQLGSASDWASVVALAQTLRIGYISPNYWMLLKQDGSLWFCGADEHGLRGNGSYTSSTLLPALINSGPWVRVVTAAGPGEDYPYCVGIKADGTMWAWGRNNFGQLGIGSISDTATPTQIGSATNWKWVYCNNGSSIAIRADGTLWAWGNNTQGQITAKASGAYIQSPVQIG